MDMKFGNVFCHECDDYAYDKDFEHISKKYKRKSGKKKGVYTLKCFLTFYWLV